MIKQTIPNLNLTSKYCRSFTVVFPLASAIYVNTFLLQPHSDLCGLCNYFRVHRYSGHYGLSNPFGPYPHSGPCILYNLSRPYPSSGYSTVCNSMHPSDSVHSSLTLKIENRETRTDRIKSDSTDNYNYDINLVSAFWLFH